ncbi:unnamed protein product [Mytilus edulis]|uniref:Macro domain-containing protein n=1 Tax=Mytilus edulis TaxID=6550 RepID=A0A8S3TSJ5_MYTED|nr:unnamed protein product [Mytilus edulis]
MQKKEKLSPYAYGLPAEARTRYQEKLAYNKGLDRLPDPYAITKSEWVNDPSIWPELDFGSALSSSDGADTTTEVRKNLAVLEDRDTPGTIRVFKSPNQLRPDIVCFLSQWDFGTTFIIHRKIPPYKDTRDNRIIWFKQCLERLKELNVKTVGLPDHIGCGLGGGDWTAYFEIIEKFAKANDINFVIVTPSFAHKWI